MYGTSSRVPKAFVLKACHTLVCLPFNFPWRARAEQPDDSEQRCKYIRCISRESNPGHIDGNDVFYH